MELHDLKSGWQQAGGTYKTEAELQLMTSVASHPSLKKIRNKLAIEVVMMTFFLFIYYDWFDGDRKPISVNLLLVVSLVAIILNDVIGYISISKPMNGTTVKSSINNYLKRIKRLSVMSISLSFLYSVSLLVFFTATITLTSQKYFMGVVLICILMLSVYFSYRIWIKWIRSLESSVHEFEENV